MENDVIKSTTPLKKYNKKYKCPYCEFKFDRDKLARHIDKYHNDKFHHTLA